MRASALYYAALYCAALHCAALYCAVLYCEPLPTAETVRTLPIEHSAVEHSFVPVAWASPPFPVREHWAVVGKDRPAVEPAEAIVPLIAAQAEKPAWTSEASIPPEPYWSWES